MLNKRLIWLIWRHPCTPVLMYFKNILYLLTFQTSKLPKNSGQKNKKYDIISMLCTVSRFPPIYMRNVSKRVKARRMMDWSWWQRFNDKLLVATIVWLMKKKKIYILISSHKHLFVITLHCTANFPKLLSITPTPTAFTCVVRLSKLSTKISDLGHLGYVKLFSFSNILPCCVY